MAAGSPILTFHSLDDSGSVISFSPSRFSDDMAKVAERGIPVVPLMRILESPGSIAITFDDGFENFARHAWPVLHRLNFPVTLFVVSGYAGRTNEWDRGKDGIPSMPLLDWTALRELAQEGVALGAHTHMHSDLTKCQPAAAEREIDLSLSCIEAEAGVRPACFAYPYGRSNAAVQTLAAARFAVSCGTKFGYCHPLDSLSNLPRVDAACLRGSVTAGDLMTAKGRSMIALRGPIRAFRQWLESQ